MNPFFNNNIENEILFELFPTYEIPLYPTESPLYPIIEIDLQEYIEESTCNIQNISNDITVNISENNYHSDKQVKITYTYTQILASFLFKENFCKKSTYHRQKHNPRNLRIEEILGFQLNNINEQTLNRLFSAAMNKTRKDHFQAIEYNNDSIRTALLGKKITRFQNPVEEAIYNLTLEPPTYKYATLTTKVRKYNEFINVKIANSTIRALQSRLFKKIIHPDNLPNKPLDKATKEQSIRILISHLLSTQAALLDNKRKIRALGQDYFTERKNENIKKFKLSPDNELLELSEDTFPNEIN